MDETKVKGLKIYMDNRFIQIMDSYQIINKNKMEIIIDEIMNKGNCLFLNKRKKKSLINQWVTYDRLYKLHILRKKTGNCIFKNQVSPRLDIFYSIFGFCKGERIWKKKKKKLPLSLELYMI